MALARWRGPRVAATLVFLLLLAMVVPPLINANRFKARLAQSVGASIGRTVTMGDISIKILPFPGFEIDNFVIADDPAFSAEPMLRAEKVTARLRISSLWKGRMEIARLSFSYPSLNLVRNAQDHWNIETLLQTASQFPAAPTAKKQAEARLRFPYIEAENGRINYKVRDRKMPHVLLDSDFALWQESNDQWNMRLEARPTRTDANLGDTGTLRMNGSFTRAPDIRHMPMDITVEWDKSQLGQLTSLLYGRDRGWRGEVRISGHLQGTSKEFAATAITELDDFRRYDISSSVQFPMTISCKMEFKELLITDTANKNIMRCDVPVADGNLIVKAYWQDLHQNPSYVGVRATNIPMKALVNLFRSAKWGVPADLTGDGVLSGYFSRISSGDAPRWIGEGSITNMRIWSVLQPSSIQADEIRFGFDEVESSPEGPASSGMHTRKKAAALRSSEAGHLVNILTFDPFLVSLGGLKPAAVSGNLTRDSMEWQIAGEVELDKLFGVAELLGLRIASLTPHGYASAVLDIRNRWTGFNPPLITGSAQLRRDDLGFPGTSARIKLIDGEVNLTAQEIVVEKLSAQLQDSRSQFSGRIVVPRNCQPAPCPLRFDLHATELDLDILRKILLPSTGQASSWFGSKTETVGSPLGSVPILGQISADRVVYKRLVASKVSAAVSSAEGKIDLLNLRANLLGGQHRGTWQIDFSGPIAKYQGTGRLEKISLEQVSALSHASWATGVINADYHLTFSGNDATSVRDSSTGSMGMDLKDGVIPTFASSDLPLGLRFSSGNGTVDVSRGTLRFLNTTLNTPSGRFHVEGSSTFDHRLQLRLTSERQAIEVTGTLDAPVISSQIIGLPETDAASNISNAISGKTKKP